MDRELEIGKFYWVQPVFDVDTDEPWTNELHPARYAGNGKWNCIGIEDESDWPMRYVGDEIKQTK